MIGSLKLLGKKIWFRSNRKIPSIYF